MRDVLVLCYHAVSDDWPAMLAIPGERLERQLRYLVDRGYQGATFTEALEAPPARRTLAVTFDDGFRSVVDRARPILDRLGLPATVFVPTAHMGQPGPRTWPGTERWLGTPHENELAMMSWEELRTLGDAGWEVGSHTRSHPWLTQLGADELAAELRSSRHDCERALGRPCRSFAYPYGDVDGRVIEATAAAGYSAGAGLPERLDRRRALCWPRVGIYRNDPFPRFEAKVGRLRRHLIGSPAGEWLVRAQIRLRAQG